MTVSDGLARTIVDWYSCPVPTVVHSALKPLLSGNALAERSRVPGAILFFGPAERLPFELIDDLGRSRLELHLYRRFDRLAGIERRRGSTPPGHVPLSGQYSSRSAAQCAAKEHLRQCSLQWAPSKSKNKTQP